MHALPAHADCLIVGGGPAGACVAGLLARLGHRVLLVDRGRARPAAPGETLLPAALSALERCGLADAVRAASQPDARRHGARWDTDAITFQQDGPRGLCLRRPAFDAALRRWASAQGAHVVAASVLEPLPHAGAGRVVLGIDGARAHVAAQALVVATGRRAAGALVPVTVAEHGPATAAFALVGDAPAGGADLAIVEAVPAGWCWWIGDAGRATAIVCVDDGALRRRGRARAVAEVLDAARGPAAALRGAPIAGAVRATARVQETSAPVFLVGDAAATLDPLASQGTEKALVGAEAAACAVHTALRHPELHALAIRHHARWERDLWRAHARAAAGFYARVARFADEPFWRPRREGAAEPAARAALPARLVVHPGLQPATVLHRVGDVLEPEPGVRVPGGEPLARLGRVVLAPLLTAFASPSAIEVAVQRAGEDPRLFVVGSAAVRQAVAELWQRGILVAG
jgi:2-polyprenyl-6-methoxyphenol hydroxylase-like FAD-dependent oxidoreductase